MRIKETITGDLAVVTDAAGAVCVAIAKQGGKVLHVATPNSRDGLSYEVVADVPAGKVAERPWVAALAEERFLQKPTLSLTDGPGRPRPKVDARFEVLGVSEN